MDMLEVKATAERRRSVSVRTKNLRPASSFSVIHEGDDSQGESSPDIPLNLS